MQEDLADNVRPLGMQIHSDEGRRAPGATQLTNAVAVELCEIASAGKLDATASSKYATKTDVVNLRPIRAIRGGREGSTLAYEVALSIGSGSHFSSQTLTGREIPREGRVLEGSQRGGWAKGTPLCARPCGR
jgi:hypothetical protein